MHPLAQALPTLGVGLVFCVGFSLGACRLPNPDHCFNIDTDPNSWCAESDPDRPYCSPCAAENDGCVSDEPGDECPLYAPSNATETGADVTETST